ncbi:MAG: hypothetical protein R2880_18140 [Deinococcales bacterium]
MSRVYSLILILGIACAGLAQTAYNSLAAREGRIIIVSNGNFFIDLGSLNGLSLADEGGDIYRDQDLIGHFELSRIGAEVSQIEVRMLDKLSPSFGDRVYFTEAILPNTQQLTQTSPSVNPSTELAITNIYTNPTTSAVTSAQNYQSSYQITTNNLSTDSQAIAVDQPASLMSNIVTSVLSVGSLQGSNFAISAQQVSAQHAASSAQLEPFHNMLAPTSEVSKLRYGVPYVNPDSLTPGAIEGYNPIGNAFARNWGDSWDPTFINTTPSDDIFPANAPIPYFLRVARVKYSLGFPAEAIRVLDEGLRRFGNNQELLAERSMMSGTDMSSASSSVGVSTPSASTISQDELFEVLRRLQEQQLGSSSGQFAMAAAPPVDQDELFFLMRKLEQEQNQGKEASSLMTEGFLLLDRGEYVAASERFKTVVEIAPLWSNGHYWLGRSYIALGELELAKAKFQDVLRLEENNPNGEIYQGAQFLLNNL